MVFPRRRFNPSQQQPPLETSVFALFSTAAGLVILWLLRSTPRFWSVIAIALLIRSLYELATGDYVRQLRGWYAVTYFPSVDLQQLCDSSHDEGEMGLPRELIDEIMHYNDFQTLGSCSLTSRAFYSAARPFIHRRMVLGSRSLVHGSRSVGLSLRNNSDQADVFHARYLSEVEERGLLRHGYVREVDLNLSIGNPEKVLQLRHLRALETVHSLAIESLDLHRILPIFDRCFSQFVPTLRSLRLERACCKNSHQLMEFICRFPHLDDLELISPRSPHSLGLDALPGSEGPQPQRPLPFGGHLGLEGVDRLAQSLLDLPGGIRFRSIEAASDQRDLAKLLMACSSTLEVLSIYCFDSLCPELRLREHSAAWTSWEMLNIDLRCNGILRQFVFSVDFVELDILPPFLHKTLTSISSPHFSEFSLQLCQGFDEFERYGGAGCRGVWGTGWEMVDEALCARAAGRDDFRFVVEIEARRPTATDVARHFPRMKSKGLLFVTRKRSRYLHSM